MSIDIPRFCCLWSREDKPTFTQRAQSMFRSSQFLCMIRFSAGQPLTRAPKIKRLGRRPVGSGLLAKALVDYSPESDLHEEEVFADWEIDTNQSTANNCRIRQLR